MAGFFLFCWFVSMVKCVITLIDKKDGFITNRETVWLLLTYATIGFVSLIAASVLYTVRPAW